jgi:G3E family GTPase
MAASATPTPNVSPKTRSGAVRFVMLGGFLGAGKTTLAARVGLRLQSLGKLAAFITNDHGSEVLDAQILSQHGFPTAQISGGSFSGQFEALAATGSHLAESHQPDVIIAECVGGCTDFAATVASPLNRHHGKDFTVTPFSVLVDPILAASFFNLDGAPAFSEKIAYLYRKQLEEADIIVINKIDLLSEPRLAELHDCLEREFVGKKIFHLSARHGNRFEPWFNFVMHEEFSQRAPTEIDADLHNTAQALLGSLNCIVQVSALRGFECNRVLLELAKAIQRALHTANVPLAHLKMTLAPEVDVDGMATLNWVHNAVEPELGPELSEPIERGRLALSLRAEGKPDLLHAVVTDALTHLCGVFPGLFARLSHMEHFRPTAPSPSHRLP